MKKRMLISMVALWMLIVSVWAQGLLVTGIVKDKETRQVLANVNVSVQGSNVGTVTNADGVFSLKVQSLGCRVRNRRSVYLCLCPGWC